MAEKTSSFHLAVRGTSFQSIQVFRLCSSRASWSLRTKSWSSRAYEMKTSAMGATFWGGSTHLPHGPAEKQQPQRPKEEGWPGTSAEYRRRFRYYWGASAPSLLSLSLLGRRSLLPHRSVWQPSYLLYLKAPFGFARHSFSAGLPSRSAQMRLRAVSKALADEFPMNFGWIGDKFGRCAASFLLLVTNPR